MYLDYFDKFLDMKPYLEIKEDEWDYIKNTFDKEDVKESLAQVAMTYEIPYAEISENDAYKALMKLKGMRHNEILVDGEWFAREGSEYRYDLSFQGKQQYFRRINTGNSASNYFQQKNRWSVDGTIAPGPERTWSNKKFMTSLMGAAYTLKLPKIDRKYFRTMIGLRKYICSQFKPNVAKVLYDKLGSENILDFSAGWGDRLAGFYGSETGKYYLGIDPRKENHPIYKEQKDFYNTHRNMFFEVDKDCDFIQSPAEDVNFNEYENVFEKRLNSHGKKWLEICNPMNDFLSTFSDSEYQGCIGMEMAKRPNSGGAGTATDDRFTDESLELAEKTKEKTFCEPIWIWKKL